MRSYNTYVVEPEGTDALLAWTQERAAKAAELRAAQDRRAHLTGVLSRDPAAAALAERTEAARALAQAQAAATTAQQAADGAATAAARYAANEVVAAQAALDGATRALSDALGELLADASTSTMLTATVDGLALRERYLTATSAATPVWDHTTVPFPATPGDILDPELALPVVSTEEFGRLRSVLDRLEERVDAVADLVAAEGVHQLVQGNAVRAGASLAVAAEGRVPDEFEVIRTPRPGHDAVHRVLSIWDPARTPTWTAFPGLAAQLDPLTAAWASRLLPDPETVRVRLRLVDADGADVAEPLTTYVAALDLDPLDWVRAAASSAELHTRLDRLARAHWAAAGPVPAGRLVVQDPPPGPEPTLSDLLVAATALGRLIAASRALAADDLRHPASATAEPPAPDAVGALVDRVLAAETWVADLVTSLDQPAREARLLTARLLEAAALGVPEALPPTDPASARDMPLLRELAAAAAAGLRPRLAAIPFQNDPADPAGTLARARARAEELCGQRIPVLVPIAAPAGGLRDDLGQWPSRLQGAAPAAVRAWLADHALVRPAVRALLTVHDLAETLGTGEELDPRVAQLPHADPGIWIGGAATPSVGAVGFVVQSGYGTQLPNRVAGLMVDSWNQAVPAAAHDSAVAFHYDQPDASPPQAILVAVHPDPQAPTWDLDTLVEVLTSTLAMARDRATPAERRPGIEIVVGGTP
ncbi:hypothetical protein GCM10022251_30550 [Phytohabitans flavus]|uniref:Uncharacterized protein n=1 Tax=Phytohabitans flavus TaxID=1076124 RepID=A0A6F8XX23_9ACTN|nr:hypothetical protein [Phytohabitans flavus]BCB78360.1 hypothetical protein Pflav_047700 [Phytohabitans flavus]